MDYKTGILVFTLLAGCLAFPAPEDDMSFFFDHTDVSARIVGGSQAAVGSHPHMVALTTGSLLVTFYCGGSILSQRTILTAAHCIDPVFSVGTLMRTLRATVGTNRWKSGGSKLSIARNVTHPHYVSRTLKNDIGLFITSTDIVLSQLAQPVSLSFANVGAGVPTIVAGWGRTRRNGSFSANLLELFVNTISGEECIRAVAQAGIDFNMPPPPVEPHIEICTFHSRGHGACNGDSGSALLHRETRQQIGVVSWGFPCARGAPDMYARISAYRDFLASNTVFCKNDPNRFRAFINMDFKTGFLLVTLLAGCLAYPTPEDDLSIFFDHVDTGARIVGGTQAPAGSHPHMVALSHGLMVRSYLCGGSLISQRTIVTAAHCIAHVFSGGSLTNSLRATVGTNRWNSGGAHYNLARNITHPHYVAGTIKNDVGLLITTSNVVLNNLVRTIRMNYANVGAGVQTRVAGWGRIRAGGSFSATLLQLDLNTIDGNDCVRRVAQAAIDFNFRDAPVVEPHIELCTLHSPGFGTCNGDSGSPLVRRDNGQQVGIVSWGFPCARGAPDMFVRVSAFQSFISSNTV
ncbi:uncharacterized protein LOC142977366 [Anticarsia gemmatalis]|uniref:uncharacterized protein LOC142977366 n=1 Tax=Anticarsia gemmatalis TaxID=129554 RepID=UPI003F767727